MLLCFSLRLFRALTALFVCSVGIAVAAPSGPVALDFTPFGPEHAAKAEDRLAPADESFGEYPMSVMGIENAIRHYDGNGRLDDGPIAYALVAIRDWERRFPRDPWIARELLGLEHAYQHARTSEGFAYAWRVARWLQTDYPQTEAAAHSGHEFGCVAQGGCLTMARP